MLGDAAWRIGSHREKTHKRRILIERVESRDHSNLNNIRNKSKYSWKIIILIDLRVNFLFSKQANIKSKAVLINLVTGINKSTKITFYNAKNFKI